jgi:large subunit ribosomal protein L16
MRGRRKGNSQGGHAMNFGEFGIKALEPAWISARQIEAARRAITRRFRRGGQVWIRVFPDKPITKKPAETRQGSGKGNVDQWVAVVRPGRILFEVGGVPEDTARDALDLAAQKLPIAVRTVQRLS